MAQNIICSLWERTKHLWPCLTTMLLLFSLLWLFSFASAFFTFLIKLIFWLQFSRDRRQAEDTVGKVGQGPQGLVLLQDDQRHLLRTMIFGEEQLMWVELKAKWLSIWKIDVLASLQKSTKHLTPDGVPPGGTHECSQFYGGNIPSQETWVPQGPGKGRSPNCWVGLS